MSSRRITITIHLLVLLAGILVGFLQVNAMPGVPTHGRYHASDMDDLQQQLLGYSARPQEYAAGADHPAWYAICGIYQKTSSALGMEGMRLWDVATPFLLGLNLVLFLALARQIGFTNFEALGLTLVLMGSGATITWSVVLETHVLAPTTLILAALILSHPRLAPRIWNRPSTATLAALGLAIALSASITITNVMLAMLIVVPAGFVRRARVRPLVRETVRRVPTLVTAGLVGLGLLALVHVVGWYLLKDPQMRHFLEILGERRLLPYMEGSWWDSILALSWIAPPMSEYTGTPPETMLALDLNRLTAAAYVSGLVVCIVTFCSLRAASTRTMFIALFPLFGVVLHSIYGRGESFLYSANYTWATVLAIGLLGRSIFPRSSTWIAICLGLVMLVVNLVIWMDGLDWIVENDYILPTIP